MSSSAIRGEVDSLGGDEFRFGLTRWTEGVRGDLARRVPLYVSDWKEGLTLKSIPAVMFLYFACLAPVIAFGGLTATLTGGAIGLVEFLVSASVAGMAYAAFSGQPLTLIGPTGLTLAFTTALYSFCGRYGLPFLPMYSWVGLWTGAILFFLVIFNASDMIRYCTRFTDDVFNSLIATNFLYEASRSLASGFKSSGSDKTKPFMALSLALGTYILGRSLAEFRRTRFLRRSVREFFADFGPTIAITAMSALSLLPSVRQISLETLAVPSTFQLANGRAWLVPLSAVAMPYRFLAIVPAILLTCLFFLDQNISVRVVNSPSHALKKPAAYHLDLLILSLVTVICSLFGLPWMCAATVQSLNHVRALSTTRSVTGNDGTKKEQITVVETRLTGFLIHLSIGVSLLLLPVIKLIPMAVISGLFLYLGRNIMTGNEFLRRIRLFFVDPELYPEGSPMTKIRSGKVHLFTLVQLLCLGLLWTLKVNKRTSLFFPSVIGTLMVIRSYILPSFFAEKELAVLDSDIESEAIEEINGDQLMARDNGL